MSHSVFSADFAVARTHFRAAALGAGAQLSSYPYPVNGPAGEELTTDVAWLGPRNAPKVFVTVSGTHGIEGFCGSGAQIDWLERAEFKSPLVQHDTAAMIVHAINPYGFAWRRRVTHENVDLNRNWIDFDRPLPSNTGYDAIAALLCPSEWTPAVQSATTSQLLAHIAKVTLRVFKDDVSRGQYRHPHGLFFGGTAPAFARRTLTQIFAEHLAQAEHIAIIDYHSGLGPPGFGEIIVSEPPGSDAYLRAKSWYGAAVTSTQTAESASSQLAGDWHSSAPKLLPHAQVTAAAIEFGTVDVMQVLQGLRADSWLHAFGDPQGAESAPIRAQLTDAFYVDADVWRGMVLGQSLAATRAALAGLRDSGARA